MQISDAQKLAWVLMTEHGLAADGWSLEWTRGRKTLGVCRYRRKRIGLSRILVELNGEEVVRLTVLHEIAHALAGPEAQHGPVWRSICLRIGGDGRRQAGAEVALPRPSWIGICPAGHEVSLHRAPRAVSSCGQCSRSFSPRHLLRWRRDGVAASLEQMPPSYQLAYRRVVRLEL